MKYSHQVRECWQLRTSGPWYKPKGQVTLVAITGATKGVPYHFDQSMKLIWGSSTNISSIHMILLFIIMKLINNTRKYDICHRDIDGIH